MKTIRWKLAVLSCIFIFSCASNVKSKKFSDDDLSDFKTFAYLPDTEMNISDFNSDLNPSIDEAAIMKMKANMEREGFSLDQNNPDLVVLIFSSEGINSSLKKDGSGRSTPGSSSAASSPYSGSSTSGTSQNFKGRKKATSSRAFQTGNMVIEIFNSKTKALVWSGLAKDFKTDIASQNLSQSMVDAIFTKFPKS